MSCTDALYRFEEIAPALIFDRLVKCGGAHSLMSKSDMCTRPRMIHEVMNLKVILLVSSEFSLDHFFHLQPRPVSALHESSKKNIIRSQP